MKKILLSCGLAVLLSIFAIAVPNKIFLNIPFISQAPFAKWTPLYNEACEEAAIIMVMRYANHKGLTRVEADNEINKLVEYQEKNYGGHFDLTAAKTARLMKEFYGFDKFEVDPKASIDTIIKALSEKHPVIVPMAGRLLKNPYYKSPGPVYHMLVLKGYDLSNKEFIANDPGTRRGLNFRFKFETINKAWSDFGSGSKALIIINN